MPNDLNVNSGGMPPAAGNPPPPTEGAVTQSDMADFNEGDMQETDFTSGDFGSLDVGDSAQEGDKVNFMGSGLMTKDGLQVKALAIVGNGTASEDEGNGTVEYGQAAGAGGPGSAMSQIMGGGGR